MASGLAFASTHASVDTYKFAVVTAEYKRSSEVQAICVGHGLFKARHENEAFVVDCFDGLLLGPEVQGRGFIHTKVTFLAR